MLLDTNLQNTQLKVTPALKVYSSYRRRQRQSQHCPGSPGCGVSFSEVLFSPLGSKTAAGISHSWENV